MAEIKNPLFKERYKRVKTAFGMQERPDHVPVMPSIMEFSARHKGMTMKQFTTDGPAAKQAILDTAVELGVDGVGMAMGGAMNPKMLGMMWLSEVDSPGVELPDDVLWQVKERELMSREDYDTIINDGWVPFFMDYLQNRLGIPMELMGEMATAMGGGPEVEREYNELGLVTLGRGAMMMSGLPIEYFCGGRSIAQFMKDLYQIPDKVQAAMDVVMEASIAQTQGMLQAPHEGTGFCGGVGGWRAASQFLSPQLWERFVWPYFKKMVEVQVEGGVEYLLLHMDSNWDRDLSYFRDLPKGKCMFGSDSATNIFKIKEVLGDTMSIFGDVPPSMLALGTPDEVYAYSAKLINEIGPKGFILASGCDVPVDAKFENVKAMVQAAKDN